MARDRPRTRVLPETELLDELDAQKDLEHAKSYVYKVSQAAEELPKMGPVVAGFGERICGLAEDVKEAVAFLEGRSYYDVQLRRPRVLASSEPEAILMVGEQAACHVSDVQTEVERLPWTRGEDARG